MAGNTTTDALLAELLGDVGKIYSQLREIEGAVPAIVEGAEKRLEKVAATLEKASDRLQQQAPRPRAATSARGVTFGKLLLGTVAGGFVGAAVAIGLLHSVSIRSLLPSNAAITYENGQALIRAWPRLDAATREKVRAASN